MAHNIQQLQLAIEDEYKAVQQLQAEFKRLDQAKSKLIEQQQENMIVKQEIDLLDESAVIKKQYGPVLITQTLNEVTTNINKRLDFINQEISKMDVLIKNNDTKQNEKRNKLLKLQDQFERIRQQLIQHQQQQQQQ